MIIDAKHRNWAIACGLLALLAIGLYALAAWRTWPVQPAGGSVVGLWLGASGFGLLVFASLLPLRKWYPLARLGSAQTWLRAHIWLSLLGSLLILLHSSFHWRGTLEQALMLLLALLVVSGIWGLIMQQIITRQLTRQIPWETFYENLPQECRILQFEGDVLISQLCEGPQPLEADLAIATDDRLKKRNVMGRDFAARLAKVYATAGKMAAPPGEKPAPAVAVIATAPVSTAPPEPAVPAEKPLSAADKITLMRAKKTGSTSAAAAPVSAEPAKPQAKRLSAAEKIALMRTKKAEPPAPTSEASAPVLVESVEAAKPQAKGLSAAEKIALMRAKKAEPPTPTSEASAPAHAENVEAGKPLVKGLSASEKIALMRTKKPAGELSAASPTTPTAAIAIKPEARKVMAPAQSPPSRKIDAAELAPFRQALRAYFLDRVRPFLGWHATSPDFATEGAAEISFARLRGSLPSEFREAVEELAALAARRRQLDAQARLYHWLHAWLVFIHIPAAVAMLVLAVAHIAGALYW